MEDQKSIDETEIRKELEAASKDISDMKKDISDEMGKRDLSHAAAIESDENFASEYADVADDFEFELLALPNDDDDDEDDDVPLEASDYGFDDDGNKLASSSSSPSPIAAKKALHDKPCDDLHRVEAVLARKSKNGRLFYRCKFSKDFVSWQLDETITNRAAVQRFELLRRAAAFQAPTNTKRRRPAVYVSERKLARLARQDPAALERVRIEQEARRLDQLDGGERPVWSCEVEPMIFMPYDPQTSTALEAAYRSNRSGQVSVMINGINFNINFSRMEQSRAGGATRRVQRLVPENSAAVQQRVDRMNVEALRAFLQTSGAILSDESLYYALSRLGELDKAKPSGCGKEVLSALPKLQFQDIMEQIANGREYPGLSDECSVCLEDLCHGTLTCLPCQHFFHYDCLAEFLSKYQQNCPCCRATVFEQ